MTSRSRVLLGNKRSTALGTLIKAAGHLVPTNTSTRSSLDIAQWRPFPKCSHSICAALIVATEKQPLLKKCTISLQQVTALSRTSHLRFQAMPNWQDFQNLWHLTSIPKRGDQYLNTLKDLSKPKKLINSISPKTRPIDSFVMFPGVWGQFWDVWMSVFSDSFLVQNNIFCQQ